jgi:hypothetical protein
VPVEIGQLVVRGTFGTSGGDRREGEIEEAVARLRREMREEMRELIEEAARRARER